MLFNVAGVEEKRAAELAVFGTNIIKHEIIQPLLEKQKEEIIKKIDGIKYSNEKIKGIGNSWTAHPATA